MDKAWINAQLGTLISDLQDHISDRDDFYFEPTEEIYTSLESGDENQLKDLVTQISKKLKIEPMPTIEYCWGVQLGLDTAGQYTLGYSTRHIKIPFYYVGRKYALGCILAHELSHALLMPKGIGIDMTDESSRLLNEMLTDLASILLGLGKLLINGIFVPVNNLDVMKIGYLSEELIGYSYKRIEEIMILDKGLSRKNLIPRALKLLE